MVEIKILPDNAIEISGILKRRRFSETKMLGELSLSFLNANYSDLSKEALDLAKRMKNVRPSNIDSTPVKEYLKEITELARDYDNFDSKVSKTPLYDYILFPDCQAFLDSIFYVQDGESDVTIWDVTRHWEESEKAQFYDIDLFDSIISTFTKFWRELGSAFGVFTELFGSLIYSNNGSAIERIQSYGEDKFNTQIREFGGAEIKYAATEYKGKPIFAESYSFKTIPPLIALELVKMLQAGISIKRCLNCGKLFALYSGHKNNYCSQIPAGETQSCAIIGPAKVFRQKTKKNPLLEKYEQIKKRIHRRATLHNTLADSFDKWRIEAEQIRDAAIKDSQNIDKMEKLLEAVAEKLKI